MPSPANTQNQTSTYTMLNKTWNCQYHFADIILTVGPEGNTTHLGDNCIFDILLRNQIQMKWLCLPTWSKLWAKEVQHPKLSEHRITWTLQPQKISLIAFSKEMWTQHLRCVFLYKILFSFSLFPQMHIFYLVACPYITELKKKQFVLYIFHT